MPEYRPSVRAWPASERPREKLAQHGASALSAAELLAIILRTGTAREDVLGLAQRLLVEYGGLTGLANATMTEISRTHGIGLAKGAQLKASLECGKRLALELGSSLSLTIRSPGDVANLLMLEMGLLPQEVMRVILLNTKNAIISSPIVYQGSANTAVLRVGELFRDAVKHNAVSLILVHNHPSGDPTPSREDVEVTREVAAAGALLDIELLDHVIIGHNAYVSLKEKGMGFGPPHRP